MNERTSPLQVVAETKAFCVALTLGVSFCFIILFRSFTVLPSPFKNGAREGGVKFGSVNIRTS